jgi:hypothetical protein
VELVTGTFAAESGYDMCVRKNLRKTRHDVAVESPAYTVLLFIFELAGKKRSFFRIKAKILAEIVVDPLHSLRPERILGV